jgi:hypothetical protein
MATPVRKADNDSASLDTSSAELFADNRSRKYALIVNASDVGVWISFGEAAVIGTGAYLAPAGGSYEIDESNLWTGAVNGIAASGSNKVVGLVEFS